MGDRVGQLEESEEYWMERLRVVWYQIWSSKVVAPTCVDWGPIVWPRWTRLSCVLTHTRFMGPINLVASTVAELDDTSLYFTNDIGIVFGPPTTTRWGFCVEDDTRVRWARLDSLIVNAKDGHSWYLCGSCVSCCQVISLARWLLIQISVTPSDMGEAYSLLSFHRSAIPCSHESFGYVNYDYLVVEKLMILKMVDWVTMHV
jgi:hypothetical protein